MLDTVLNTPIAYPKLEDYYAVEPQLRLYTQLGPKTNGLTLGDLGATETSEIWVVTHCFLEPYGILDFDFYQILDVDNEDWSSHCGIRIINE